MKKKPGPKIFFSFAETDMYGGRWAIHNNYGTFIGMYGEIDEVIGYITRLYNNGYLIPYP